MVIKVIINGRWTLCRLPLPQGVSSFLIFPFYFLRTVNLFGNGDVDGKCNNIGLISFNALLWKNREEEEHLSSVESRSKVFFSQKHSIFEKETRKKKITSK